MSLGRSSAPRLFNRVQRGYRPGSLTRYPAQTIGNIRGLAAVDLSPVLGPRPLKTTRHPHTNMAKAALNMMTRTAATDYVNDGIHMNSVDTGWVTDEDPIE